MKNQKNKHHYLIVFIFTILVGIIFAQADEMSAVVGDSGANVKPLKVSNEAPATPLDKISRIAFSPDGNALANVDDGGAITLRDVTTGLTLWDRFDPLNDVVTSLAFSLDGKTLASVGKNAVIFWEVASGQERATIALDNTASAITQAVFSPDKKYFAAVNMVGDTFLWNFKAGLSTHTQISFGVPVGELTFSPDGKFLVGVTKGRNPKIKLRDVVTGRLQTALPTNSITTNYVFSPNSEIVASVGRRGIITLWNPHSGSVKRILDAQEEVTAVAFSPDSKMLAVGCNGEEPKIQLWNPVTGELIFNQPADDGGAVTNLFYSPDGSILASISKDHHIRLRDVLRGEIKQIPIGQDEEISKAAFNSKQPTLAAIGKDQRLIVWDLLTGLEQQSFQIPTLLSAGLVNPQATLSTSVFSGVNSHLTTANSPNAATSSSVPAVASSRVANNPVTSKVKKRNPHKWKGIKALAISQDGTELGAAGDDGIVRVFKKNGKLRWNVSGHHGNAISGLAFRGKAKQWVSVGRDTEIKTWDDITGNNLQTFYGPEHPPRAVAVSPDGRFIATAGEETRVFLFDAVAGKLSKIFSGHIDFVNALAFSPDGKTLASAGAEGRTFLWEVNTGKPVRTLLGHSGEVNAVAFSPDGTLLATASEDSTVILWNLTSGRQIKTLSGHQGSVRSIAFSPNGKKLVSAGEDTRLMVWDSATWQLRKQLAGPPAAVNVLAFDPVGNLHVGSENSEVTEVNTDTGTKVDTIAVPVPVTSTLTPQVSSGTQILPPVILRQGIASLRESHGTLSAVFNQILDWMIPSAQAALPPNQGPGGPILIVTTAADHFGEYYAEILRAEGFNEFSVTDISTVTEVTLAAYDVVILAEMPLNTEQELTFNNWVNSGGNLIAMRPDKDLASLLGLTDANATLSNAYLLANTSASPGSGIVGETMQFHSIADRYTLSGATNIATLYSNAVTATSNPAVTLRKNIGGIGGGKAAAFTYDLAKSIVYTHQGNPAWATQERDGFLPKRSDDKFYGDAAGDPQPDWIDLSKVTIPQADEQQRLLVNLILEMNHDKKPLPRFWYFPRGLKAVVIMTGDDHANNGTPGRFDAFLSNSVPGCVVNDWECVRGTSYIYPNTALTNAQAANYNAQGFEVGLHVNTNCADFTPAQLEEFYVDQISSWTTKYSGIPAPITQRHHCIAWSDWATAAKVQLAHGIRLDTSYYFWPPNWVLNKPGFFSGSGMPMRFADVDGSFIDVYQATSQMTDESGQSYPFTINSLLDKALGPEAYYGAFTVNAHTDVSTTLESVAVVESAFAHSVPVITSRQMMDWLDYRNSSFFGGVARSGNTLSFSVNLGTSGGSVPANSALKNSGLQVLLPLRSTIGILNTLMLDGVAKPFTSTTVKGVEYAAFSGVAGSYVAIYAADTTAPTVTSTSPASGTSGISQTVAITATFSEAVDPATVNASTLELRDSGNNLVASAISYNANTHTAALTPSTSLAANATYTATVKGGTTDPRVNDLAGNALAANVTWSFTTQTQPCAASSCSAWSNSTTPGNTQENDPSSVELGVKFRSDIAGLVTGIRFYQTNTNAGSGRTFQATLWDFATQTPLATGTITTTASGWLQVNFPTSFAISANTVYVASYHAPNGNYAGDNGFFAANGINNAPLHLLKDGENGGNGVYAYGASRAYPSNTWQASNYWVDVVFSTNVAPDTTAPTVTSTVPAASASGVNPANLVTVTFSETMTTASISGSTFQLMDSVNAAVSATVTYSAGSNTATLSPTIPLTESTTYTAKVIGGVNGVKDLAGNPLIADKTWSFATGADPCSTGGNPIVCENSKIGNPASEWDISGAGDASIQGFVTDISVNKGSTIDFKIDTTASAYRLDIYRMGYYGGNGARKLATIQPSAQLPQNQPNCLTDNTNPNPTGLFDCGNWSVSASWAVPSNATSGIYFAKAVRLINGVETGGGSHIVFIVRDDASTSDIFFQTADTTWQAYNNYGGNNLYTGTGPGTGGSSNGRAYKVSYNRPFNTRAVDGGQDWVFNAEYPMVRWLEANGYNVSYTTGVDSDRRGNLILNHKLFMSNGHDEYWSGQQRANVEAARDAVVNPVNLAFFSGNEVFWKTRWEKNIVNSNGALGVDDYRTLVCYKETHNFPNNADPTNFWTGTWRDPRGTPPADGGRPENALLGLIFMVNDGATTSIEIPEGDGKMRFWRNTTVANLPPDAFATLPFGTLGYEWDVDLDNGFRPAGIVRLSTTIVPNAPVLTDFGSTFGSGLANHALTLYKANSGAIVFGAGTVQWAWGLDSNHDRGSGTPTNLAMQQATVNLFADMGIQPSTMQFGLLPATASTDTTTAVSSITSPAANATVSTGSLVVISGTATDIGGRVGGVEVSVDGGLSWHPANGRSSWTYAWTTPSTSGQVNIKARAVDDSLNLEIPGVGIIVNVGTGTDTTPPTTPGSLVATPTSGSQVNLNWTASTDVGGLVGYRVERCAGAGCTNFTEIATPTAPTHSDNGLTEATTYRYRVRAADVSGNLSAYSNTATAIPDATAPGTPNGLTANAVSGSQVNLAWTAPLDNVAVTGYQVERCQGGAGCSTFTQIASHSTAGYLDTGVTAGTSYQYRVRARDAAGNLGAYSSVVSVTTPNAASLPTAVTDTFLFRANVLRTVGSVGSLGLGVLANDTDSSNLPLSAQVVGNLPTGVTLATNGVVTINRSTNTSFNYRANNGSTLSLPTTGTLVNLRVDGIPTTVAENCTYNRAGSGSITSGSACAMTGTRVFSMNLTANDSDPNTATNVPTDGVGDAVVAARISATGTGVAVSANTACGQAAIVKTASRATIANNCNGTITVTVNAAASASPISLTYRALDDLGAQSATRNDVVIVQ